MGALRFRYQTFEVGDHDVHVRTLRDTTQFSDDEGLAEALGISSAAWPLFGVVWDAGRALARVMVDRDVAGRRILEVGCGIGLPSLLLARRGADITATDHHPAVAGFLAVNAGLNGVTVPFVRAGWADPDTGLGRFDLIVGSDLLYEPEHVGLLSGFVDRHALPGCEVVLLDAGRGQVGRFLRRMAELGYTSRRSVLVEGGFRGHLLELVSGPPRGAR